MLVDELRRASGRQPLLVSARTAGLGDCLLAAANCWLYARQTGRAVSICWFHSLYLAGARDNAFPRFFELPPTVDGVPVSVPERADALSAAMLAHWVVLFPWPLLFTSRSVGSIYWKRQKRAEDQMEEVLSKGRAESAALGRRRLVVFNSCLSPRPGLEPFFRALALRPHLARQVDEFAARHFHGRPVIGVHIRYYDPALPYSTHTPYWKDREAAWRECDARIAKAGAPLGPNAVIFLATDSAIVLERMRARYPDLIALDKPPAPAGAELHASLGRETADVSVLDMFLLARCQRLVRYPSHSWFSHYASLYVPVEST